MGYNGTMIKLMEVHRYVGHELAIHRIHKVYTVCKGKRKVQYDYEEAKANFLKMMMSTESEQHDRADSVYIQLLHGLDELSDEDE